MMRSSVHLAHGVPSPLPIPKNLPRMLLFNPSSKFYGHSTQQLVCKLSAGILQQTNLVQGISEMTRLACQLINTSVQAHRGALADPPRGRHHAEG